MKKILYILLVLFFIGEIIIFSTGCGVTSGRSTIIQLNNENNFKQLLLRSKQPVMIEFYKGACPTCVMLEGTLDKLAKEYDGKVVFARFEVMTSYFHVNSETIKELFRIEVFPTVILFVNKWEQHRWELNYSESDYKNVLDGFIIPKTPPPPSPQFFFPRPSR